MSQAKREKYSKSFRDYTGADKEKSTQEEISDYVEEKWKKLKEMVKGGAGDKFSKSIKSKGSKKK